MYLNDFIGNILNKIETSINSKIFINVEKEILELKDLSSGQDWKSLKETMCAFLNTNGGYIICGIRERENNGIKSYNITGFDRNNESNLIDLNSKTFYNDSKQLVNVPDNIAFEYRSILNFNIAVIHVKPLSEDNKYVSFNHKYYERILTQDKEIIELKLNRHNEYKQELEYSKEISTVENASIEEIEIDKVNQFIVRLNSTLRKETLKKDIDDAKDFLNRKYCLNKEDKVTILGLLLFGRDPFRYLEYRCEIDCYFETGIDISRDKKYFQNDVLSLVDDAFSFVWGHIKVGRSVLGGGRSEPEFPERLIREVINNAIAHRDYVANKFITIKVNPGSNLSIINPGSFKSKMILSFKDSDVSIRRIVAGVPETRNPKLANVLKTFDKIESQGIGMATLVSVCLDNQIDMPYFDLSNENMISLTIPSGKLLDEEAINWLMSFRGYLTKKLKKNLSTEHEMVLTYLYKSEKLNERRFYTILLNPSNNHFDVLTDLIESKIIKECKTNGNEFTPVYILESELHKSNFNSEIESISGMSIDNLDETKIKILNIIFRYNKYSYQSLKPSMITPELYRVLYGKEINPLTYENLGRKVRKYCNELFLASFLKKKEDKTYYLYNYE